MRFCLPMFVLFLLPAVSVRADLYTAGTLSLEWLVDSADDIFLLELEKSADGKLLAVPKQALKEKLELDIFKEQEEHPPLFEVVADDGGRPRVAFSYVNLENRNIRPPLSKMTRPAREHDQWLLFVRQNATEAPYVVRAINLMRPRETSTTAAITKAGTALAEKQAILKAVEDRLSLKPTLAEQCKRELIDQWLPKAWVDASRQRDYFLSQQDAAEIRGGFSVPISCDYWDSPTNPEDTDEDLLLTYAIVPADPEFQEGLLESMAAGRPSDATIFALLNYPGEETLKALRGAPATSAKRVLFYLEHRDRQTIHFVMQFSGAWVLQGRKENVSLILREDFTCLVDTRPKGEGKAPAVLGKGYWGVTDEKFWLCRSHLRQGERWVINVRSFFPPKKIERITSEEIFLEGGPPMVRPAAK